MDILIYTAVVLSCTEIVKVAFVITKKFVPFVALMFGALFFVMAYQLGAVTLDYSSIMEALVGVLSAMGIYSGIRATTSK